MWTIKTVAFLCALLLGLVYSSLADTCNMMCPDVYQPVCGYDRAAGTSKTYGNDCELIKASCNSGGRVVYAYEGPCNYLTDI